MPTACYFLDSPNNNQEQQQQQQQQQQQAEQILARWVAAVAFNEPVDSKSYCERHVPLIFSPPRNRNHTRPGQKRSQSTRSEASPKKPCLAKLNIRLVGLQGENVPFGHLQQFDQSNLDRVCSLQHAVKVDRLGLIGKSKFDRPKPQRTTHLSGSSWIIFLRTND